MTRTIAGHTFADTPTGRRCVAYSSQVGGTCNIRWVDIRSCTEADVEVPNGLAHQSKLTLIELAEIRAEVEREETAIWAAVIDAASAGSR